MINFEEFRRRHMCRNLLIKLLTLQICNFIKNESLHSCFLVNFAKFPRIPVLDNTTGRLLLIIQKQPSEVFCEKYVLRNFAKFIEKQLCQSIFFNKVAGLRKKETMAQVFSCKFCKMSKNISKKISKNFLENTFCGYFWLQQYQQK